jgi:hypothetical protein
LLKVTIRKIELGGDAASTTLYESTDGTEVVLESGKVDLSGITLNTALKAGTYDKIKLTVAERATVKGCVSGNYNGMYASGLKTCGTDNTSCEPMTAGSFTYCTTSGEDIYSRFGTDPTSEESRSQFGATAQESYVRLAGDGVGSTATTLDPTAAVEFQFELPEDIAITEGSSVTLSMVVDLNAFLKFDFNSRNYAAESSSGEMFANMKDKAFFYAQSLTDVSMVFAGTPGTIEGYEVDVCAVIAENPNDTTWAYNWMTLIYGTDGALIKGLISTMDPTGYVALNGQINGQSATTRPSTLSGSSYTLNMGSGVGSGTLTGFTRVSTLNSSGYIAYGGGTKTNMDSSVAGDSNFDWKYTLRLINSNPLE